MDKLSRYSVSALLLLAGLVGSAAAQTNAKASTNAAHAKTVAEAPQATPAEAADAASTETPVNTGEPEGKGKWVPRLDKKTCPNGSETYIDEKDGGVKCWVNTN